MKKVDISGYLDLSCLPEESGKTPDNQSWANSRVKIVQVNEKEILSKNLLIIILAGMFWGCSTYNTVGHKFDTTAIDRIELGKTTESDVISMLGAPRSEIKLHNGIVIYNYVYGDISGFMANSAVDSLQIQLFNGIVINKSQRLSHR